MSLLRSVLGRLVGSSSKTATSAPPPPSAAEWRARGNDALAQGRLEEAAEHYRQATHADPGDALARLNLGFVLLERADAADAEQELVQALAVRRPEQDILHEIHYLLGRALRSKGDTARAITSFEAAVQAHPAFAEPIEELVGLLHEAGRFEEALQWARRLHELQPVAPAQVLVAQELHALQRHEEALELLESALRLDPSNRSALVNRTTTLLDLLRLEAAVDAATAALALYPDDANLHWNLATASLLQGRFEAGWREHEWRWQAVASRSVHPFPDDGRQWTGAQDLRGRTILLFAEHGLGDSLQMLRYVPLVAARAGRVLLQLPPMLHGLQLTARFPDGVILVAPDQPLPAFDFHCALMSLPLAFGSDEKTIPRQVPYLAIDPVRVEQWQKRLKAAGKRLRVGVTWSGRPSHDNDRNRSIPLTLFRQLETAGCFFVSLQPDVQDRDRTAFADWPSLHRWGEELVDFDDTAALIRSLDLVISVDTSVAHLAGALGAPVWVLLPHCPDWRWMVERSDSPWYPSARLFRQHRRQDWSQALADLRAELGRRVEESVPMDERDAVAAPRPSWPDLLQRAQAEFDEGDAVRALGTLDRADELSGPHLLTQHLRGNALFKLDRHAEALLSYEQALARKPDLAEALANSAVVLNRLGRPEEALQRAEEALRLRPDHVITLSNRVIALQSLGRHAEALEAARQAHLQLPDEAELEWGYGATALLMGEYAQGWPALEARWALHGIGQRPKPEELGCAAWTGREPVGGRTLLLIAEQGLGDSLQFVRYAPLLTRKGARVVLCVPRPLEELMRTSMPDCVVVTRMQDAPRADFHIPMMGLPLALGTTLGSIPADVPYLRASAERIRAWEAKLPVREGPLVGIAWSGNAAHLNDRNRSLPLASLLRIAAPGVRFVSLQREVRESDRPALRESAIHEVADQLQSFADTAALAEHLDLVISVDTSVAHLAGALGRPLWVLLPQRPDWRWLLDRADSPWYPTARLFRQPRPGDWDSVIAQVHAALAQFAATGRASA